MYDLVPGDPPAMCRERDAVRGHLRDSTAEIHARLERLPIFSAVLAGHSRTADVVRLLRAYHDFHTSASLNLQLGYRELEGLGVPAPTKGPLALLARDLDGLGARLPTHIAVAQASTRPQAVGWVWVVEGSVLGARVIHRALDALFGESQEGRRFFQPLPDSGTRWRAVCSGIENYGRARDALGCMAAGAHQAFACMERSLKHAYDESLT